VLVDEIDDAQVAERTRPDRIGAASTAADVHVPIMREQENRPIVLLAERQGRTNIGRPGDIVKTAFFGGGLLGLDALRQPGRQLVIGAWPLLRRGEGNERRK
jgi:hypothetical protein